MADFMDGPAQQRLRQYFDQIGLVLGDRRRRESFAVYAFGLFGDGERKSMEPIAARACADPRATDAAHQRLLHFATDSPWSDHAVRRESARYALEAMTQREAVEAWIGDDTGFIKQGSHSVGVQRQYTGSVGKVANCQLGVSLSIATRTEHLPIDFELYLPKCWADDPVRCAEARIPENATFKTKPELALDMIRRAIADGVPRGVFLGDTAYGSSDFRKELRSLELRYAVGLEPQTNVTLVNRESRPYGDPVSVRDLAFQIRKNRGFRRCTWREGTKEDLSAQFALRRVLTAHDGSDPQWLIIEWRYVLLTYRFHPRSGLSDRTAGRRRWSRARMGAVDEQESAQQSEGMSAARAAL